MKIKASNPNGAVKPSLAVIKYSRNEDIFFNLKTTNKNAQLKVRDLFSIIRIFKLLQLL